MAAQPPLMSAYRLIRDHGTKTKLRCGCCGLTGVVWNCGDFYLCSWCDVEADRRWR